MKQTILSQLSISEAKKAQRIFQNQSQVSNGFVYMPLVLIPNERSCCSCLLQIPSGVHSILHKCEDDFDEKLLATPGLHCYGPQQKVAFCVTYQSCTYNAPLKSCPTSDNVMIDCDLTLVFMIGPEPKDVKNFVYKLGADQFNEFLCAATQEGIRQLVRSIPHQKVYELRGGNYVRGMLGELNEKFKEFGITFTKAAITDVKLSKNLATTLQATTEFESKIKEEKKRHEHLLKDIDFELQQKIESKTKVNERSLQDIEAQEKRELIDRERLVINGEKDKTIAATKAREKAAINITAAKSSADVASLQGRSHVERLLAETRSTIEAEKIKAERECKNDIYRSEKVIDASKDFGEALEVEANYEKKIADTLREMREHELKMEKINLIKTLSGKGKIVISGKNGERLINSMLDENIMGKISLRSG